ncbi:MAG: DUF3551 domain-containing protein [Pseudorhodoplanes sp.]
MRTIPGLALAIGVLILPASPAAAQRYTYDIQYCSRIDGAMECAYFTLRQCLAAVSATGGDCAVNPRFSGDPVPRRRGYRGVR